MCNIIYIKQIAFDDVFFFKNYNQMWSGYRQSTHIQLVNTSENLDEIVGNLKFVNKIRNDLNTLNR